jgi:superfamily I DNA/RNA helicase
MNEKNVRPYAEFINKIRDSRLDGVELFDFILDLEDINGKKIKETIIALQKNQNSKETMDYTQNNDETLSAEDVKQNAQAPLDILRKLIAQRSSMEEAIEFLENLRFKGDQLAKKKDDEDNFKAVMLDTCHGWKGLEAKHVVVPMNDGTFPPAKRESQSDEEYQQSLEDERRLAYVALTRGRDKVKIITSLKDHKGKPARASQFIEEGCIRPNAQGVSDFSSENIRLSSLRSIADSVLAYTITDDDLPDSFFR